MTAAALTCRDVTIRHEPDQPPTLSGISLSIRAGERVALVGLNGSGKTTLLQSIAGLVPHEGEIEIGGEVLGRKSIDRLRRGIGFLFNVPEDQLLFPKVIEDVAFGLIRSGMDNEPALARAAEVLDGLGAGHLAGLPVHHLSHGQKQRVALAGAIVADPALLLLDEPSAGLDPPGRSSLAALLSGLGAAQFIATHDLGFADEVCSRVILLEGGTIAADCAGTDVISERWKPAIGAPGR